jgi:hypothetical protein
MTQTVPHLFVHAVSMPGWVYMPSVVSWRRRKTVLRSTPARYKSLPALLDAASKKTGVGEVTTEGERRFDREIAL